MRVGTGHISRVRNRKGFLDITVKSGVRAFAPTWDMVAGYKSGRLSEEQYAEMYYALMRKSYVENKRIWENLLEKDEIWLGCYCCMGDFCHRYLLRDMLETMAKKRGVGFTSLGEV